MERITPYVREEHIEQIDEMKKSTDSDISDAEAVRRIFDRASEMNRFESKIESVRSGYEAKLKRLENEHESEIERYEAKIESLEARVEDLQRQLAATNRRVDEHKELVEYVQEERSITQRRARAGLWTKTKWALFGMSDDE
jgi:uncharacterized protein involved in exopolysaccharide biosynthesis